MTDSMSSDPLEFPSDFSRNQNHKPQIAVLDFDMPTSILNSVVERSASLGIDNQDILYAAFQLLISRYTGKTDFSVAIQIQTDYCHVDESILTESYLMSVNQRRHNRMRFLNATSGSKQKAQIAFNISSPSFDLHFTVQIDDQAKVWIQFDENLFERDTIHLLYDHYCNLVFGLCHEHSIPMFKLKMLSDVELNRQLIAWNKTEVSRNESDTLVGLFEEQVRKSPDHIAVTYNEKSLSYRQLNEIANHFARTLRTKQVRTDEVVGVFMDRSLEMVIALYGIIKSGCGYLPIEPSLPESRIQTLVDEANVKTVLTQEKFLGQLGKVGVFPVVVKPDPIINLDRLSNKDFGNLNLDIKPDSLAYCIFTSGSTGKPKGVMISHRSICNRLRWMQEEYRISNHDKVLQKTPFSFDVSVWEFFWPLQCGATLVILDPELHRNSRLLLKKINDHGITTMHFIPNMLLAFLEDPQAHTCQSLKRVFSSGEAMPNNLPKKFYSIFPNAELHNLYGPTEAAVDITYWKCKNDSMDMKTIPIGRPVANSQVYILDSHMRPLPRVSTGELYLGGVQLARGYLNRPDLTSERFVPNPFSTDPLSRLYKTGDLARWTKDGIVEYLGRNDFQVKIAGLRIELGEIESILNAHPLISQAAVIVRTAASGAKQLVAFLIPRTANGFSVSEIRHYLAGQLPAYMVPQHFNLLTEMPLSSSGKVDRSNLLLSCNSTHKIVSQSA